VIQEKYSENMNRDIFELEKMRWSPRSNPSKGPRRLCKFCLLAVAFPIILLCIPLYMRFLALKPQSLILSPSDMKLLNQESVVSTAWCESQILRMNSSFHAYLFNQKPTITAEKKRVRIQKEMLIKDDLKKYWGFYLLRGSTVRLGGCARWPGASVVVVEGTKDARRCAWLGELDSQEESDEFSNEFNAQNDMEDDLQEYIKDLTSIQTSILEDPVLEATTPVPHVSGILDQLQNLSPDQRERIMRELMKEKNTKLLSQKNKREIPKRLLSINKNSMGQFFGGSEEDLDADGGGGEVFDHVEDSAVVGRKLPDHLAESGVFDQTNKADGKIENSNEEVRSSDSSSEEALRNCHGVIVTHEFLPQKKCDGVKDDLSDAMEWYPFRNDSSSGLIHINHTGFYYFIYSNENEIMDNTVVADIQLHKTRFNTNRSEEMCLNSTDCQLDLTFWSDQHILVEVPEMDSSEADCSSLGHNNFEQCNYVVVAESECKPRGTVYMVFLLLVPVIILIFASI